MEEQMMGNHKVPPFEAEHAKTIMDFWVKNSLVPVTDPILKKPLDSCSIGLDRKALQNTLKIAMEHHQGIGLSANQIGIKTIRRYVATIATTSRDCRTLMNCAHLCWKHVFF